MVGVLGQKILRLVVNADHVIRIGQAIKGAFPTPERSATMGTEDRNSRNIPVASVIPIFPGPAFLFRFVYLTVAMRAKKTADNVPMFKRPLQSIDDRGTREPTAMIGTALSMLKLRERYPVFPLAPAEGFVDDVGYDFHLG